MRYSRSLSALLECGQVLPCSTLEFLGSVNWTMPIALSVLLLRGRSIHACFGLDVGHVVGQRVGVHRPVVDGDLAGFSIEPGQRVLHPVLIVAVGKILTRMRAAALGAIDRGVHGDH